MNRSSEASGICHKGSCAKRKRTFVSESEIRNLRSRHGWQPARKICRQDVLAKHCVLRLVSAQREDVPSLARGDEVSSEVNTARARRQGDGTPWPRGRLLRRKTLNSGPAFLIAPA